MLDLKVEINNNGHDVLRWGTYQYGYSDLTVKRVQELLNVAYNLGARDRTEQIGTLLGVRR